MTPTRLFLVVVGVLMIAFAIRSAYANARARTWPSTAGVIRTSSFDKYSDAVNSLEIEYEYKVGEQSYISHRIGFMLSDTAKEAAAARFQAGTSVRVFYDPSEPSRAVLVNDPSREWIGLLAFGAVFLGAVLFGT